MKSLIYLIIVASLVLVSCKKENLNPNPQIPTQVNQEIRLYGKWLLVGGSMYVENIETGEKTKYDHFGPGKTTSSLNYDGSVFAIEVLELNTTTWSFYEPPAVPGFGDFVLNGDIQHPYGFMSLKIIGLLWNIHNQHLRIRKWVALQDQFQLLYAIILIRLYTFMFKRVIRQLTIRITHIFQS